MVSLVASLRSNRSAAERGRLRAKRGNLVNKIFDEQEGLVKQLAAALKNGDEKLLMDCIKKGERNLEKLGVVGKKAKKIIQKIESLGGAAKILGGGGVRKGSGMILAFHKNPNALLNSRKEYNWELIKINL